MKRQRKAIQQIFNLQSSIFNSGLSGLGFKAVAFFKNWTSWDKMITRTLKSIIPPALIVATWLFGSKEIISFPEPVVLLLIGVMLIGFADIGKKKPKKK